ncbi:hypothetical protein TrRE_jg7205, partial [Triparma retinervis]
GRGGEDTVGEAESVASGRRGSNSALAGFEVPSAGGGGEGPFPAPGRQDSSASDAESSARSSFNEAMPWIITEDVQSRRKRSGDRKAGRKVMPLSSSLYDTF